MAGVPVTLAEVVEAGVSSALSEVHTSMPGKVVAYDPVSNTLIVEPCLQQALFGVDGTRTYDVPPQIPAVPVVWPRAGGFVIRMPIQAGDYVLLIFSEGSLAEWKRAGGVTQPQDARRHSVGYPVAVPGLFPTTSALNPVDAVAVQAGAMIFGEDGGKQMRVGPLGIELAPSGVTPIAPVALAPGTLATFSALATYLAALTSALAAAVTAGPTDPAFASFAAAMATPGATVATALGGASGTVPSTLVKAV